MRVSINKLNHGISKNSRHVIDNTIHNSILNKAPKAISNLIDLRSVKYNLRRQEYVLSLPKVNTTKYGLKSWKYFAAKKLMNFQMTSE